MILYASNQTLLKAGSNGMLWFLPCLFFALMGGHVLKKSLERNYWKAFVVILICITIGQFLNNQCHGGHLYMFHRWGLPFALDVSLIGIAFVLTGYLFVCHGGLSWITKRSKVQLSVISLSVLVSLVSTFYHTRKLYPQMATGDIGNWYVYFIVAVISTLGVLALSQLLSFSIYSRWLIWLGKNSLTIFLVHRMMVGVLQKHFLQRHDNMLMYLLCFLILSLFSIICTNIINKFFPYLVGKNNQTN